MFCVDSVSDFTADGVDFVCCPEVRHFHVNRSHQSTYANREEIVRNFREGGAKSYNASFLYPKEGCIRIVNSVASHVEPSRIATGERLIAIDPAGHTATTTLRTLHYDRLISTMPLTRLMDLCGLEYNRDIYSWNKVLVFNLGFDSKGPDRRNCWLYIPESKYVFYRVGFYDNIIGQDRMSLYVEIGFGKDEEVPEIGELLKLTLADLKGAGIVTDQRLVAHHHVVMDPAYVHITSASESDKQEKFRQLAAYDIYSIGRYGAWKYCSLEDNMYDAFQLAGELAGDEKWAIRH